MYDKLYTLKPFFADISKSYHIREFARILKINPMTARKYLLELAKEGLIEQTEKQVLHRFRANLSNTMFREYKILHNVKLLHDSGLIQFLHDQFTQSEIILTGAYQTGKDTSDSAIEIIIVSDSRPELDMKRFEKMIGRPIKISIISRDEYNSKPHIIGKVLQGSQ
jgi:hypothetical protein